MNNLKNLMKIAGLNNPGLAKLIGCKPVEIWRLAAWPQQGGRKMTPEWAAKIAPHLGIKPHELLFGIELEQQPESEKGKTIELRGQIGRGLWAKRKDEVSISSSIPKLNGSYWNFDQYAYQTKNSLSIAQPPGMTEYVVCVDFFNVRKSPLDGDLVVVEFSEGEMVERQIYKVTVTNKGFNLDQLTNVVDDKSLKHPVELMGENGCDFVIKSLVIGWVAYT